MLRIAELGTATKSRVVSFLAIMSRMMSRGVDGSSGWFMAALPVWERAES